MNLQQEERQLRARMRAMPKHKSRHQLEADLKVDNLVTTMRNRLGLGELVEDKYYSPTENTSVITGEFGRLGCGCNKNPSKSHLLKLVAMGVAAVSIYALLVQPLLSR